jgi:hypothetical protein
MKQYIGIVRDHSVSMVSISNQAKLDYNSQIETMQHEARVKDIDTLVSVVEFGSHSSAVRREVVNASVGRLKPLPTYLTNGGSTPLFDAVNELVDVLESVPDAKESDVAFLVMVITDGENNVNGFLGESLGKRIRKLQATDHWTFTFRVPFGKGRDLSQLLGIPMGNIFEWEQTERGFERATVATNSGTRAYFSGRAMGQTMSSSFYADVSHVPLTRVKRVADDITQEVQIRKVVRGGEEIRPFVENNIISPMRVGGAFYQLTKPEAKVQPSKQIILRDKKSGRLYGGQATRDLLGLPHFGDVKLSPGDQGQYDVFVQSTSVNRKLIAGTDVVYWPNVRY